MRLPKLKLPTLTRSTRLRGPLSRLSPTMRRNVLFGLGAVVMFLIPALIFSLLRPTQSEAAWFDDSWAYRFKTTITNSGGTALTDYQVMITLDTQTLIDAGKMSFGCRDIRITDINGKLLNYWVESNGTTSGCYDTVTNVWVKVPSIPAAGTVLYFYYGNPQAQLPYANGKATFEFFDDFDSFDNSVWTATATSSATVSGGDLTITAGSVFSKYPLISNNQNQIVEMKSQFSGSAANYSGLALSSASRVQANNAGSHKLAMLISNAATSTAMMGFGADGNAASYNTVSAVSQFNPGTSNVISGIAYDGSNLEFYNNRSLTNAYATGVSYSPYLMLGYYSGSIFDTVNITDIEIDWIWSRKFAATEPTTSNASEERAEQPLAHWKFDDGADDACDNFYDACDSSINRLHLIKTGATWLTEASCKMGKCLSFDGSGDYAYIEDQDNGKLDFAGSDSFSITGWFKHAAASATQVLLTKSGGSYEDVATNTVDTVGANTATSNSQQRKTWYDGTRWWTALHSDTDNRIEFWYSPTGSSWTENTGARIAVDTSDFSIEGDSSNAFIAYTNGFDIETRKASSYPGTSFTWSSATITYNGSGASDTYAQPSIAKNASGNIWVMTTKTGPAVTTETFTGESSDGEVAGLNAAYATARSTSGGSDLLSDNSSVGQRNIGSFIVSRAYLDFNTSTIPDTNTVTSATLSVGVKATDRTVTDFDVRTYRYAWTEPLSSATEANYDGAYGGSATLEGTLFNTASVTADNAYTMSVTTSGVSKTGDTKYAMVSSRDVSNTTPAGEEIIDLYMNEAANSAMKPQLTVTHQTAANFQIPQAVRSTAANDISAWGTPTVLNNTTETNLYPVILSNPISGSDEMYALWREGSNIIIDYYDGASWNFGDILTTVAAKPFSAAYDTENSGLSVLYLNSTNQVNWVDESDFGSPELLDSNTTNDYVSLSFDRSTNYKQYAFWKRSTNVFYKSRDSLGNWDGSTTTVTASGTNNYLTSSLNDNGTGGVGLVWTEDTTTDAVKFFGIDTSPTANQPGYTLKMESDGDLTFEISDGTATENITSTAATYDDNNWHHVTAVKNGTTSIKLYIDGVEVASDTSLSATGSLATSTRLYIGIDRDTSSNAWNGALDDFKVYPKARSADQIKLDAIRGATDQGAGAVLGNQTTNGTAPVGYWNLDENSTSTAYDTSGNGNNMTLNGSPTRGTPGKFGQSLDVNGSSTYGTIPDNSFTDYSNSQDFSVMAWVKIPTSQTSTTNTQNGIIEKWDATGGYPYVIRFNNSTHGSPNTLMCARYDGTNNPSITTSFTVNDNLFHHVACVKSGSTLYLYYDGKLVSSTTDTTSGTTTNSAPVYIGRRGLNSNFFNGSVDDLKIYNYGRSSGQVVEDMNAGHPLGGSPIGSQVLYWPFDEMTGSTANSRVGGSTNAGTLAGISSPPTIASGWQPSGKRNAALMFDGSGDSVTLATANDGAVDFNGTEAFTLTSWVKVNSAVLAAGTEKRAIITKWDANSSQRGYRVFVENDDNDSSFHFTAEVYDESTDQTLSVSSRIDVASISNWYHVAVTFNGGAAGAAGDLKMYVNGQETTNTANASFLGLEDVTADFVVGEYDTTDTNSSNIALVGTIDEIKVYPDDLTASQVLIDMNDGAAINAGTGTVEASQLTSGAGTAPIAHWSFDENTGTTTANDKSGYGNHLTLSGITSSKWIPGKVGSALNFNGSDRGQASDSTSLDVSTGLTIEFWVKPQNLGTATNQYAVFKDNAYFIALRRSFASTFDYRVMVDGSYRGYSTSTILTDNVWQHVAATYDSTSRELKIYVNGKLDGTTTLSALASYTIANSGNALEIASDGGNPSNDGAFDDIKIYNYARSQSQIAYDYNRGAPTVWYKFDECQGTTAYNSIGSGFNGTITPGASGTNTSANNCTSGSGSDMWANGATGKYNSALDFDGTNDYVDLGSSVPMAGTISAAAWVYLDSNAITTNVRTILTKGAWGSDGDGDVSLSLNLPSGSSGTGKFAFVLDTTAGRTQAISTEDAITGRWVHVAGTWDGTNIRLYIDGQLKATTALAGTLTNASKSTLIGAYPGNTSNTAINGRIDDVQLYNYTLTEAQIKAIMNNNSTLRFGPATGSP